VSRETAQAEDLPGGFGAVYKVLRSMEERGSVRRGYFVEGLTGAQFAHPGAVDRLRAARPDPEGDQALGPGDVVVLAAVDPANPYGALIAWPPPSVEEAPSPRRVPGAWVVLVAGHPVLYAGPRGRHLLTFPCPGRSWAEVLPRAVEAWLHCPQRRGRVAPERIDGQSVFDSPHLEILRRCGFERGYRGLVHAGGSGA
jgi:ATP-dependent Lhr-like helicase